MTVVSWELRAGAGPVLERIEVDALGTVSFTRAEASGAEVEVGRWAGRLTTEEHDRLTTAARAPATASPRPSSGGAWWVSVDGDSLGQATGEALAAGMLARSHADEPGCVARLTTGRARVAGTHRLLLLARSVGVDTELELLPDPPGRPTAWSSEDGDVLALAGDPVTLSARPITGLLPDGASLPLRLHGSLRCAPQSLPVRVVLTQP